MRAPRPRGWADKAREKTNVGLYGDSDAQKKDGSTTVIAQVKKKPKLAILRRRP